MKKQPYRWGICQKLDTWHLHLEDETLKESTGKVATQNLGVGELWDICTFLSMERSPRPIWSWFYMQFPSIRACNLGTERSRFHFWVILLVGQAPFPVVVRYFSFLPFMSLGREHILWCFEDKQGEIRKSSSVISAKKWRKTIEWERLEISIRKLEIPREYFMQRWYNKGQKWYGPNRGRRY